MKRSPLIILAITLFIDMLGFGLILPLLPIYIRHYGGEAWVGGMLLATFSTMQFIFSPIWGRISDSHGRRPMILLSLSGSAISYFFFGAAPNLAMLFVARVASGILTAASIPTSQAYIADVTPPEKRAAGMGMMDAAFGLGFAFGPVVSGVLSQHPIFGITPLAMPAFFAAAMAANFVWAFFMLPESHTDRTPTINKPGGFALAGEITKVFRNPSLGPAITVYAFATFAFAAVESCFSWLVILRFDPLLHANAAELWRSYASTPMSALPAEIAKMIPAGADWKAFSHTAYTALPMDLAKLLLEKAQTRMSSIIFSIVGVTILVVQGAVMGGLARRIGEKRLVVAGVGILAVTLLGIAFAQNILMVEVLSAFIALGSGIMNPSLTALITHAAGPSERGAVSGAQQGLGSFARIVAPPINNTLVMQAGGLTIGAIPFLSSFVLMAIAFVLSVRLRISMSAPVPGGEIATADEAYAAH